MKFSDMKPVKHGKVESGIPIPDIQTPFAILSKLKPGDSVLFGKGLQARIRMAASTRFGRGNYSIRTLANGVRVWRTK